MSINKIQGEQQNEKEADTDQEICHSDRYISDRSGDRTSGFLLGNTTFSGKKITKNHDEQCIKTK